MQIWDIMLLRTRNPSCRNEPSLPDRQAATPSHVISKSKPKIDYSVCSAELVDLAAVYLAAEAVSFEAPLLVAVLRDLQVWGHHARRNATSSQRMPIRDSSAYLRVSSRQVCESEGHTYISRYLSAVTLDLSKESWI